MPNAQLQPAVGAERCAAASGRQPRRITPPCCHPLPPLPAQGLAHASPPAINPSLSCPPPLLQSSPPLPTPPLPHAPLPHHAPCSSGLLHARRLRHSSDSGTRNRSQGMRACGGDGEGCRGRVAPGGARGGAPAGQAGRGPPAARAGAGGWARGGRGGAMAAGGGGWRQLSRGAALSRAGRGRKKRKKKGKKWSGGAFKLPRPLRSGSPKDPRAGGGGGGGRLAGIDVIYLSIWGRHCNSLLGLLGHHLTISSFVCTVPCGSFYGTVTCSC